MGQWTLKFDDEFHTLTLSKDGSFTAYSKEYEEHYHSTKDGALKESLKKHVIPAFKLLEKEEINILDICYGLGFNTLATVLYYRKNRPETKLNIYSPELDVRLIRSLEYFSYPQEFTLFKDIIATLSQEGMYEDKQLRIELFLGDAREYIVRFKDKFDIVYQDAFSPSTNPILWTKEYFRDIANAMKKEGILTTYSIAFKTRMALYENGFNIYLNTGEGYRDATIASQTQLLNVASVDMQHKISCNPHMLSLRDKNIS